MTEKATPDAASLPYHEPNIVTILILSSFLLLLNVFNYILDRYVYCGLLGQVFLGVAWGTPLAQWLSVSTQEFIVQIGYLGLILLVYEGGLGTPFATLKRHAPLSALVALTGIVVPIALSFTLQSNLLNATSLQAFAAGAALCSTSLGTTFSVLAASGLGRTRLGVVLSGAAMMDDVVGLVMVQVITELGGAGGGVDAATVMRPVGVSIRFAPVAPLICWAVVKPATGRLNRMREEKKDGIAQKALARRQTASVIHTLVLVGLVAAATLAGTSNLFAAYLAGAAISWWDTEVSHVAFSTSPTQSEQATQDQNENEEASNNGRDGRSGTNEPEEEDGRKDVNVDCSGTHIYEVYYHQPVEKILKPLFFASIGFSIPITQMFSASVVWRGVVYAILMTFAKLVCGLWLVRFSSSPLSWAIGKVGALGHYIPLMPHFWGKTKTSNSKTSPTSQEQPTGDMQEANSNTASGSTNESQGRPVNPNSESLESTNPQSTRTIPPRPLSLYPAAILGTAMVARGEIGFLVSSLAASNGIFTSTGASSGGRSESTSDIFLVVTWAIVLCTIIGPLSVGLLVRRVRRLEAKARTTGGRDRNSTANNAHEGSEDGETAGRGGVALGAWGVDGSRRD